MCTLNYIYKTYPEKKMKYLAFLACFIASKAQPTIPPEDRYFLLQSSNLRCFVEPISSTSIPTLEQCMDSCDALYPTCLYLNYVESSTTCTLYDNCDSILTQPDHALYYLTTRSPTHSPTRSPTHSPTNPECSKTSDCTDTSSICRSDFSCGVTFCTTHFNCSSVMLPGRLGVCSGDGFCVDEYSGTCNSHSSCIAEVNQKFASANALGKQRVSISQSSMSVTKALEVTNAILEGVRNASEAGTTYAMVDGSFSAIFNSAMFSTFGDNDGLLQHIKSVVCGDVQCEVQLGAQRRILQSSGAVVVSIEYSIDSTLMDQLLKAAAFNDPQFIQDLALATGLNQKDIVIYTTTGSFEIEFTVAQEAQGNEPLDEEALNAVEALSSALSSLSQTLTQLLSIPEGSIQSGGVDKCGGRDCNGIGTCDPLTGACACQVGWWGVNCGTAVVCENGATIHPTESYCICNYPYWGKRCSSIKTECTLCTNI